MDKCLKVSKSGVNVVSETGVCSLCKADVATELAGVVIRSYLTKLACFGGITVTRGVIIGD